MNLDQEEDIENTFSPPNIYDQQYPDFVKNLLKEVADDFEREKKCTFVFVICL